MKVTTNTPLIENRVKWAKRIAPVTMLLLVGGLVTNFLSLNQPEYLQPTMALLALGFVSAILSSHLANHWIKEPRADQTLTQLLKKFGNDYLLFNYTGPVSHVLLAPDGLYSIVVKNHPGQITVDGSKFSRKFSWGRVFRFFADEGLGAPILEAEKAASKLKKFLGKTLNPEEIPPIKPLVLFTHKEVELLKNSPDAPVLTSAEFKLFLREQSKSRVIATDQRAQLSQILNASQSATTTE
jgi:hypothetical protein